MRPRGQVLAELAVALPLILFLIIGATEVGFLLIAKAHQDRSTAVVAQWAAGHPGESWNSVASHELPGCDVTVSTPLPDLIEASVTCRYRPVILDRLVPGLLNVPMTSQESAPSNASAPSPSPTAGGSASS